MNATPPKKLPSNAKRVFKGVLFDVWQWEQKMYDGSTQTFERIERVDTVDVIPVLGDKIMLGIQEQPDCHKPFLSFFGGRCDQSEDSSDEAKRELLEESGCVSNDWKLWFTHAPSGKIMWTVFVYVARNCTFQQPPHLDAGEKITTTLITFDEFLLLSDEPTFRDKELVNVLLHARLNPKKREQLRRLLWPIQ